MITHKKNQKLRRPCSKCEKYFVPTGRDSKICPKCFEKVWIEKYKLKKKRKDENKL